VNAHLGHDAQRALLVVSGMQGSGARVSVASVGSAAQSARYSSPDSDADVPLGSCRRFIRRFAYVARDRSEAIRGCSRRIETKRRSIALILLLDTTNRTFVLRATRSQAAPLEAFGAAPAQLATGRAAPSCFDQLNEIARRCAFAEFTSAGAQKNILLVPLRARKSATSVSGRARTAQVDAGSRVVAPNPR
jgi:hypothetical protein